MEKNTRPLYLVMLGFVLLLLTATTSYAQTAVSNTSSVAITQNVIIEKPATATTRQFVFTDVIADKFMPLQNWLDKVNHAGMTGLIGYTVAKDTHQALLVVDAAIKEDRLTHIFNALGVSQLPIQKQ